MFKLASPSVKNICTPKNKEKEKNSFLNKMSILNDQLCKNSHSKMINE